MSYNKPPSSNIPFEFTPSGYTKPYSDSITFKFGPNDLANLKAAINVLSYNYIKKCTTIVVGYGSTGIPQILKLPCVYGGIRDIGSYIYGNLEYINLNAYIFAVTGKLDLHSYIKSVIESYKNLPAYIKTFFGGNKDIIAAIRRKDHSSKNLVSYLFGWQLVELYTYIDIHRPIDLFGILNVIEIRNIFAVIFGELYKSNINLNSYIGAHPVVDLTAFIRSKFMPFELYASIYGIDKKDITTFLRAAINKKFNLTAIIGSLLPTDLSVDISGVLFKDEINISSFLVGIYGPYDLRANIYSYPFFNLSAIILGKYGSLTNLKAIVNGLGIYDLSSYINTIEAINLNSLIVSVGKFLDLQASIIPKIVRLKKALLIPLLEHKDLAATINFACFGSKYVNLKTYLYTIYKKDLTASLWGWIPANNAADLKACINTADYSVEDKYTVKFVPEVVKYTQLKLSFNTKDSYIVFDTLPVFYSDFTGSKLSASITGILTSFNLSASITPVLQVNYNELPDNVWPKTHEIVIDFDAHWKENWRRTVELLFHKDGVDPYHYFYVDGNQQVYKLDRSRHWTIWAKSYVETDDMIEQRNVRRKYIFKMSDYATIDEAIRDIIDRVSTYRQTDLNASITSTSLILPPYKDLSALLNIYGHKWVRNLRANLVGVPGSSDLSATVDVVQIHQFLHFTNSGYTPDSGDSVSLTFE